MRIAAAVAAVALIPCIAAAQVPAPMSEARQIASAVLPLPAEFRDGATVLGYRAGSPGLVTLRRGNGAFNCLATNPALKQFHVACYHASLEPFMERGRSLRARGVKGDQVDSARFADIRAGRLAMPTHPAALYTLTGPAGSFDPSTGRARGASALYVVYIPGATAASTGISETPAEKTPWIMYPGTPKAHIMFVPSM